MKDAEIFGKDSTGALVNARLSATGNPLVAGDVASGVADSGNPVKVGGIGRTANPTAVSDGQRASLSLDKTGRQLVVPYQMRDLVSTAYVSLTTGTETTLLAGVAATFLDLLQLTCANQSTAAVQVDIRSETGGGVVETIYLPATATFQTVYQVPKRQNTLAATWTADLPDITGTTVTVSADFVQNI